MEKVRTLKFKCAAEKNECAKKFAFFLEIETKIIKKNEIQIQHL